MAQFLSGVERPRKGKAARVTAFALISCCMTAFVGCAPKDGSFVPGRSDGPLAVEGPASTSASVGRQRWEHFERVKGMEVLSVMSASQGHGTGAWTGEIRGSEGVGLQLDALVVGQTMKRGTVLVEGHTQVERGTQLGLFAMEKREDGYFLEGGNWEYVVVGREGMVEARGRLEMCARCHAEAPVDFVFPRTGKEPVIKDE